MFVCFYSLPIAPLEADDSRIRVIYIDQFLTAACLCVVSLRCYAIARLMRFYTKTLEITHHFSPLAIDCAAKRPQVYRILLVNCIAPMPLPAVGAVLNTGSR